MYEFFVQSSEKSCKDYDVFMISSSYIVYFSTLKTLNIYSIYNSQVSTAAFHARVRGSFPALGSLKITKMFLPHPLVKLSIVRNFHDREVASSASDRQGSNLASCV